MPNDALGIWNGNLANAGWSCRWRTSSRWFPSQRVRLCYRYWKGWPDRRHHWRTRILSNSTPAFADVGLFEAPISPKLFHFLIRSLSQFGKFSITRFEFVVVGWNVIGNFVEIRLRFKATLWLNDFVNRFIKLLVTIFDIYLKKEDDEYMWFQFHIIIKLGNIVFQMSSVQGRQFWKNMKSN